MRSTPTRARPLGLPVVPARGSGSSGPLYKHSDREPDATLSCSSLKSHEKKDRERGGTATTTTPGGTHLVDFAVVDDGFPTGYLLFEHTELALALLARLLLGILVLVGHGVAGR